MSLFTKLFGTRFKRELKRIRPIVEAIHRHEEAYKNFSEAELQAQTAKFRQQIAERTGAMAAEVERLKRAKHDCPDPNERAQLADQLGRAERDYARDLRAALDALIPEV